MMRRGPSVLVALLLIGAGVVLLLQEADLISEDVSLWPMVLLGVGFAWFVERLLWRRGGPGFVAPLVVFAIGLAFLLRDLDVFEDDDVLAPLVVIAVGVGLVLAALPASIRGRGAPTRTEVPLDGASRARVEVHHGAGRLRIGSHLGGENLVEGTFGGGVDVRRRREGDRFEVTLSGNPWRLGVAWPRPGDLDWSMTLARRVPIDLALRTGASATEADLSDLAVEDLRIETGASKTIVTIPSAGRPSIRIRGGAAQIKVVVPSRMAARIQVHGALAEVSVDQRRFPRVGDREYRSPDQDEAPNRAEIQIDAGAANVDVS